MNESPIASFGVLLRDKIAELDDNEVPHVAVENDPVERLRLGARQVVRAGQHGLMTRSGHQAYVIPSSPVPAEPKQRHLNIVR